MLKLSAGSNCGFEEIGFKELGKSKGSGIMRRTVRVLVLILLVIFVVELTGAKHTFASSSFAVYSKEPFFGMNADINGVDLDGVRLLVESDAMGSSFTMLGVLGRARKGVVLSYNDRGLFSNITTVPQRDIYDWVAQNTLEIGELVVRSKHLNSLDDIFVLIEERRLVPNPFFPHHSLHADTQGRAIVAEIGEERNQVIPLKDNYLLMTNFYVQDLQDSTLEEIGERGLEIKRYQIGNEFISNNICSFDLEKAFLLLELMSLRYPLASTKASVVVRPLRNYIYLALDGDFSRIWKVDLENRTIEGYAGFSEMRVQAMDHIGLTSAQLSQWK